MYVGGLKSFHRYWTYIYVALALLVSIIYYNAVGHNEVKRVSNNNTNIIIIFSCLDPLRINK
jgi:hypothetical protein